MTLQRACAFVLLGSALGSAPGEQAAAAPPPPSAIVSRLYGDFSAEAAAQASGAAAFIDQPRSVLLRYLTPTLADLLRRDRRCGAATRSVCKLDFMPLWDSQDAPTGPVRVRAGAGRGMVDVRIGAGAQPRLLRYQLVSTRAGWRICDIAYGPGRATLRQLLGGRAGCR